jgi:tetratricopeptide (TPR) repeat protein
MIRLASGSSCGSRFVTAITLAAFVVMLLAPLSVSGQTAPPEQEVDVSARFQEIIVLKAQGDYDRAIEELNRVIAEFAKSDQYVRLAYSHLVATYQEKGDVDGANRVAREALEKYPDILAQDVMIPSYVNTYYETLRKEMFGRLTIQEPEGCRVFLSGNHVGTTPLQLGLVRVGAYDLVLSKSGYHDYTERIQIESDKTLEKTVSLARVRGKGWWLTRVGAGIAVIAATAFGVAASQDEPTPTPEPEPLSGPPAPPE